MNSKNVKGLSNRLDDVFQLDEYVDGAAAMKLAPLLPAGWTIIEGGAGAAAAITAPAWLIPVAIAGGIAATLGLGYLAITTPIKETIDTTRLALLQQDPMTTIIYSEDPGTMVIPQGQLQAFDAELQAITSPKLMAGLSAESQEAMKGALGGLDVGSSAAQATDAAQSANLGMGLGIDLLLSYIILRLTIWALKEAVTVATGGSAKAILAKAIKDLSKMKVEIQKQIKAHEKELTKLQSQNELYANLLTTLQKRRGVAEKDIKTTIGKLDTIKKKKEKIVKQKIQKKESFLTKLLNKFKKK